jgi:hypothetical protein
VRQLEEKIQDGEDKASIVVSEHNEQIEAQKKIYEHKILSQKSRLTEMEDKIKSLQ